MHIYIYICTVHCFCLFVLNFISVILHSMPLCLRTGLEGNFAGPCLPPCREFDDSQDSELQARLDMEAKHQVRGKLFFQWTF